MMPPALATKSGAQRMLRSASSGSQEVSASWLLAAPATTRQRRRGIESWSSRPPSAQGATTSTSAVSALSGSVHSAPSSCARARLDSSTSVDDQAGAVGGEAAREVATDVAEPDDRDRPAGDVRCAECTLAADADRGIDAHGGPRARVARPAAFDGEPADVLGDLGHHLDVGVGDADVLGGDVAALGAVDGVGEVVQGGAAAIALEPLALWHHDHALAAAHREVRARGLVGHALRQAHRIADARARVGVGPHATAAERRAADRGMDGDDAEDPGAGPSPDDDFLVFEVGGIAIHERGWRLAGSAANRSRLRAAVCGQHDRTSRSRRSAPRPCFR